jgi:uncharacterized membrane protein HdeD (DUF308 family)
MQTEEMDSIAGNWWLLEIRGLVALAFGVLALFWPQTTLSVLVRFFGIYAIADGILALGTAIVRGARKQRWGGPLAEGVFDVAAGVVAFAWPAITASALLYLIAAWAVLRGIGAIGAALRLRKQIENEWMLALGGAASVLFGIFLFTQAGAGVLAVMWVIGAYAALFGFMLIGAGFRLRSTREMKLQTG